MPNYNIIISKPALDDLNGIYQYFAEQLLLPKTAAKTVKNIEDEINYYLSYMPHYPFADDGRLAQKGIRKMVVKKYLVLFIILENERTVSVERIIHGARRWESIINNNN